MSARLGADDNLAALVRQLASDGYAVQVVAAGPDRRSTYAAIAAARPADDAGRDLVLGGLPLLGDQRQQFVLRGGPPEPVGQGHVVQIAGVVRRSTTACGTGPATGTAEPWSSMASATWNARTPLEPH